MSGTDSARSVGMDPPAAPPTDATAWDDRVERALGRGPAPLRRGVLWLREPSRRLIRIPAGILLILGGIFSILPVLGLWMLPLGLALLGEDLPPLKGRLERAAVWVEGKVDTIRRLRQRR